MRCPICGSENCQIITSMPVLSEFCAVSAQKENRLIQSLIGCVIHAGRNGKYKQNGSDLDVIHEDV